MTAMAAAALNLSWITEDLAIGGSFTSDRVEELAGGQRIAAVIDVRHEARDDDALLHHHGIEFLHLPTIDHRAISPSMIRDGVAFAVAHLEAARRILIHCEHGIGRSALLALCVLVARGHAPLDALELAKGRRALVCPNTMQFEAWAGWLRECGHVPPPFGAFASIAYRDH